MTLNGESMLLTHGRIFDGTGNEDIPDGSIWIEGDEIRRVGPATRSTTWARACPARPGRPVRDARMTEAHSHCPTSTRPACGPGHELHRRDHHDLRRAQRAHHAALRLHSSHSFGSLHAVDVGAQRDQLRHGARPRYVACGRTCWAPRHDRLEPGHLQLA